MKFALREGGLAELGGKALALLRLQQLGLPVPAWFVVPPAGFTASLTGDLVTSLSSQDTAHLNSALASLQPCDEVRADIETALRALGDNNSRFAVRSSAVEEDSAQHSFAGQLETFLFVAPEAVSEKVADVWRSGFSERVMEYRRQHGLANTPVSAPAVLVQRMVNANVSGVAFSADPVSGRRS